MHAHTRTCTRTTQWDPRHSTVSYTPLQGFRVLLNKTPRFEWEHLFPRTETPGWACDCLDQQHAVEVTLGTAEAGPPRRGSFYLASCKPSACPEHLRSRTTIHGDEAKPQVLQGHSHRRCFQLAPAPTPQACPEEAQTTQRKPAAATVPCRVSDPQMGAACQNAASSLATSG